MKFVYIFLIFSFIGISVFSVFAMNYDSNHWYRDCIAKAVKGVVCPDKNNPFSFIIFHFDILRSFSRATFVAGFADVMPLLIALASIVILGVISGIIAVPSALAGFYFFKRFFGLFYSLLHKELAKWLALHEMSPAIL